MPYLLQKFTIGYTAALGIATGGIYYYIKDVEEVDKHDYPLDFKRLIYPQNRFALFQLPLAKEAGLLQSTKLMFSQPLYQLEYHISQTSYNEQFTLSIGDKIGNLELEAVNETNATFRYLIPGYNFRLYLGLKPKSIQLGFVGYSDSALEEWGSRVYLPMLLKGFVDQLNK